MATKKISDLHPLVQLSEADEFVVVDKSTTGSAPETGLGGRTTKVTFADLKEAVGTSGPQGERGPQGNAGPKGDIGPVGPIGPKGPAGGFGTEGPRGPVGPIGPTGDTGVAGPVGPRGDSGPRGPAGTAAARGPKGDMGDTGPRGATGPQGSQGVPGERGATGPMGRQGDKGASGSTGPMGPKGKDGANGAAGAKGQKGDTGTTGPTGRAGIDAVRNFCSDKNWPIGRHSSYSDEDTGGNFAPNGGTAENEVVWGEGPFGYRVKIWQARKNDTHSGGDGGWNKKITGLDKNKSYVSVTYIRRTHASTNGSFYHGPDHFHADNCLNLNGSLNRNPYFSSFGIGTLPLNAWCISIGYLHANNDPSQTNNSLSGLYRLDTGEKLRNYIDFKMKNSVSGHRTYLFYSTDPNASLDWCLPGFYEVNSDCPVYRQLLGLTGISGTGGSGGDAGPQGPAGARGPTGSKGDRGPVGPQGPRGYTGASGGVGARGQTGSTGARGPTPTHGWSGTSLRFIQSNGAWGSFVNLKGSTGARGLTGATGPRGLTGASGPAWNGGYLTGNIHTKGNIRWDGELQTGSGKFNSHLYMYDGNNAGVLLHGHPDGTYGTNYHPHMHFRRWVKVGGTRYWQDQMQMNANGNLYLRGGIVQNKRWGMSSDIRKKKDISQMESGDSLNKIIKLNPVRFQWKVNPEKNLQMGLIAQEVEKILPSVIDENEDLEPMHEPVDGKIVEPENRQVYKNISYNELIPLLISAMQEQQKQIDELKKQIESN